MFEILYVCEMRYFHCSYPLSRIIGIQKYAAFSLVDLFGEYYARKRSFRAMRANEFYLYWSNHENGG